MVARNERERRRGEIEVLLGAQDPNVLVGEVSPFSGKFWKEFHDQFRAGTQRLFGDLCRMLPGIPAASVLANAWAVAAGQPLWLALLARSVDGSQDEDLLRERDRLVDLTLADTDSDPLADAILQLDPASDGAPPDLRHCGHVMPGLRLRYALAHDLAAGASPLDLVQVAANQPNASTWIRRRELLRALRVVAESRASLPQLTKSQFWALPPRQQRLVISHPEVMALLLPKEIAGEEGLHAKVDAAHRAARTTRETLCRLRASLATEELIRVQSLLQGLTDDVATLDQAKVVFAGLGSLPDNNASWARYWRTAGPLEDPVAGKQPCGYVPLTPHAKKLLLTLVPGFKIPTWWKLTPAEIAARLARGGLAVSAIPPAELARVSQGWGTEELAMLAAAGLYGLVPKDSIVWERLDLDALCNAVAVHASLLDLIARRVRGMPNALPVLAMLGTTGGTRVRDVVRTALGRNLPDLPPTTWGHWTADCIGTSVWMQYQWFASTGMDPLREGMALLESGRKPLDTAGFRNVLRGLLVSEQCPDKELVGVLVSLMVLDQELGDQVLLAIPVPRLARLVQSRDLPAPLRSRLEEIGPPELRDASWRYRLSRVATADQLRTTILERPDQWTKLEWNHDWLALPGTNEVKALPLVLVAKRDPKLLLAVRARMSEAEFASAVREAADLLPATRRRERGYLQLVAALGSELCKCIKVVLMQSDRGSAPGCRLDALYREYMLPKKSGGNRVISVPPRHLKRVQRAILEKLLTPLGAHDAAFGFVPKRSILGNASVHVGQRVVSNVDVSNCFPSVKWPLVLGVLRRDLGCQIGQEAISLLVDICTSKGGLPIGAPTSPALLNRVLLRTDEVLHRAALARECRYTRYADDLTFSGDHRAVQMLGVAKRTLSQIGLALDEKKTSIYRPGRRQMVTGLVVNQQVAIPRRIRRRLRAAIHAAEKGAQPHWHGKEATLAATTGRLAFLCKVHPEQGAALKKRWQRAIKQKAKKTDG